MYDKLENSSFVFVSVTSEKQRVKVFSPSLVSKVVQKKERKKPAFIASYLNYECINEISNKATLSCLPHTSECSIILFSSVPSDPR